MLQPLSLFSFLGHLPLSLTHSHSHSPAEDVGPINQLDQPMASSTSSSHTSAVALPGSVCNSTATPPRVVPSKKPRNEWSLAEEELFIEGLDRFGPDCAAIAELVGTRTVDQVRAHWKYLQRQFASIRARGGTGRICLAYASIAALTDQSTAAWCLVLGE